MLKNAEKDLLKGKADLEKIKEHYNSELTKLRQKSKELDKYKSSIDKLKKYMLD